MIKIGLLCGVIMAMSVSNIQSVLKTKEISKSCDTKFIVELNDEIDDLTREEAIAQQNKVFREITNRINRNSEKLVNYTVLNNAISISGNKEDADLIRKLNGVKAVTEDKEHLIQRTENSTPLTFTRSDDDSGVIDVNKNASAQTMEKPDNTNDGEGTLVAILDNEFYFRGKTDEDPKTPYNHEVFTALASDVKVKIPNNLTLNSILAKGTHAQKLSKSIPNGSEGSLWFNKKVPFYYDYAGDSHNGSTNGAVEDYNVASEIGLHGSHVASIASANADNYKGIAPKAQLACMKVFTDVYSTPASEAAGSGKHSSFSESGFLSALEDAITIGADVINVSIGSDLNDFDMNSLTMRTLSKLTEAGVCSAISNGNAGKASYAFTGGYGNWTRDTVETGIIGSFANNGDTMSIAAGQPDWVYYENALRIGNENVAFEDQVVNRENMAPDFTKEHKLSDLDEPKGSQHEWVYVPGFGTSADYKNLDVEGKIAVVNRGSIDFATKYSEAKDAGAKGLIIINNDPTANDFNFRCSFGDTKPTIPVALVLFKDKPLFQNGQTGTFTFITKQVSENKVARTVSDYSSDGARFDLDLKPEITTPGSNIRGAVWPQNKEEKETPYAAYEYFNGTSMAAPNYAGAVSVLVSKLAKGFIADGSIDETEEAKLKAFRKTVNMRFMSTAVPMTDTDPNGENNERTLTSPRMQGAGMANIGAAYNTDVYLEGLDSDGTTRLNKSKILLRNNSDIAKGDVKLSFITHNDSNVTKKYNGKVTVMRPATVKSTDVLNDDYNFQGEISSMNLISGSVYYDINGRHEGTGENHVGDAIKIGKDIEYYATEADYQNDVKSIFAKGYYTYNPNATCATAPWEPIRETTYQSIKDIVISEVNVGEIVVAPGEHYVDLETISIPKAEKDKIAELYQYGTYIEGFISLEAQNDADPDLSMPYLGFYSLTDKDASMSYDSAPVVEPFSFEKNPSQIYPSDLVNDVTKQLLGKDNVEFGSMWLAGYAKSIGDIDKDDVLTNVKNFDQYNGFDSVGTVPALNGAEAEFTNTPSSDIYVGNPLSTNTMIIQQFVLRSVFNNYFTITNKATNEVVYKSALEDMLFGDTNNDFALFKSHVDANYLGAGYVAHRAYAIVPLYDPITKTPFTSGEYEMKFNYQLAGTGNWVSKAYNMHIDSEAPVVHAIGEYSSKAGDMVRIQFKDTRVAYAIVGSTLVDVEYDVAARMYYADVEKDLIIREMNSSVRTSLSKKRLFITVVDYARGQTGAIVHFKGQGYNNFEICQGEGITSNNDFSYENGVFKLIELNEYYDEIDVTSSFLHNTYLVKGTSEASAAGCLGSMMTSSISVAFATALATALLLKKKKDKKLLGGNK